ARAQTIRSGGGSHPAGHQALAQRHRASLRPGRHLPRRAEGAPGHRRLPRRAQAQRPERRGLVRPRGTAGAGQAERGRSRRLQQVHRPGRRYETDPGARRPRADQVARRDRALICPGQSQPSCYVAPMPKVLYERDGRIARITLNRPEVLNAIDDDMPRELAAAVERADADETVHVIVLAGAGRAFCAGYDLTRYAQGAAPDRYTQDMPWDPMKDYAFMMRNTERFMSLFRSKRPVICKVHGFAVAGGSDIALCADIIIMADDARIGYMPVRVWGCPTTAMWLYRLGAERAKRMLF